jgi:hypothetical protein
MSYNLYSFSVNLVLRSFAKALFSTKFLPVRCAFNPEMLVQPSRLTVCLLSNRSCMSEKSVKVGTRNYAVDGEGMFYAWTYTVLGMNLDFGVLYGRRNPFGHV